MDSLSWVWASPPDRSLLDLAARLEESGLPQGLRTLKHNRNRTVWLVPDRALVLKHYRGRPAEALKTALMGGRAEREFRAMEEFCRVGLPSARPVAYADRRSGRSLHESWLISEEVQGARSVAQALDVLPADGPEALRLARRAMSLTARLHEHPFWHRDLHAGNLLLDQGDELVILDLHSVWRVPRLWDACRWENLARLLFSMRGRVALDRSPALAAHYAAERKDAPELVVAAVQSRLSRFATDAARGRTARCLRVSSEYERQAGNGERGHRRRDYPRAEQARDLAAHLGRETLQEGLLARGRASCVTRTGPPGAGRIVKHYLPRGPLARLRARLGLGRARGAWRAARRCRVLDVPTPEALAMVECRDGRAWLVTREVWPAVSVTDYAEDLTAGRAPHQDRRSVAWSVGHAVGRLWRAGLRHADLSGKNVLISAGPAEAVADLRMRPLTHWPRVDFIDLDNMRRCRPYSHAALARMLGQLGDVPAGVSATDERRFVLGLELGAGRGLPPGVIDRAAALTAGRQARRCRREAHSRGD